MEQESTECERNPQNPSDSFFFNMIPGSSTFFHQKLGSTHPFLEKVKTVSALTMSKVGINDI